MKKLIGLFMVSVLNRLILWCFGWKSMRGTYRISRNHPVVTSQLYRDPTGKYGWLPISSAIRICESRLKEK